MSATTSATGDVEKQPQLAATTSPVDEDQGESLDRTTWTRRLIWYIRNSSAFEYRGIEPVAVEDRTDTCYINALSFWTSMNFSILPIVFGMTGPLGYYLSLRDSSLVILFFSLLCGVPCSYLATLGPKTGMRQMSQARYSFGYYFVSIPILLNLATLVGYCVMDDVIGGEVLAAISGTMSWNVGIAIIGVVSFVISALGYKILHYYERFAWLAALFCTLVLVGVGGKHLHKQSTFPKPEASTIISFGGLMAGYYLPWAAISSDFFTYMPPHAPSKHIFWYTYIGLIGPSIPLLILGAAIGGAAANVPTWSVALDSGSTGDVLAAMLSPVGGFGKFVLAILALSIIGNLAGTIYAVTLNFQALLPLFTRIPRFVYAIITTVIMIPVAVKASDSFFANLENFVGVIAYWSASWVAVVLVEHFWFRKGDASKYSADIWYLPKALPPGVAAILASALSFALVIPCMYQIWYVGPIGAKSGDLGFEVAFVVTAILYLPFRYVEIKICGHL